MATMMKRASQLRMIRTAMPKAMFQEIEMVLLLRMRRKHFLSWMPVLILAMTRRAAQTHVQHRFLPMKKMQAIKAVEWLAWTRTLQSDDAYQNDEKYRTQPQL